MPRNVRIDRGWIWPGMVFFVLGVLLATFAADAPWLVGSIRLYAPVVQGVGLFLAWRYRRSRVAAVLIGLFMMDVLLRPSTLVPGVGSVWDSSGVLFLFLMAVVAAMKDRGVLSPRGLIQSAVIPAGLAGGLMLWAVRPLVRIPHVRATFSWNAPPGWIRPVYRSPHMTLGARHLRYSLRSGALCHCTHPRFYLSIY